MNIKKDHNLISFLKSLDLSSLELSSEIIQNVTQAVTFFESLGVIRQKLIKNSHDDHVSHLDKILEKEIKKSNYKKPSLFPNNISTETFGISSIMSDPHTKLMGMNDDFLARCYEGGKIVAVHFGNNKTAKFGNKIIEPGCFMGTLQEFLELMNGWTNPRVVQHWCALWNWACQNHSFVFPYVPINDILETVYSRPKNGKFCMRDRQAFSTSLRFFHNATIEIPVTVETIGNNGRKKKEEAIRMFRLFNLDLAKKNKKGDVYLKIAGEILPGLNAGKFRGRIFPKGIFELNAGQEGNRILLVYRICNRQDQLNGQPLQWSKEELIKAAGLEATYNQHKGMGCYELTRTLQRLIEVNCISDIEPKKITSVLIKPVTIHPFNESAKK